jgi:hypothetical protein
MPITTAQVKQELERRKFPSILTLDDYVGITDATCRELTRYTPISKWVSFKTTAQVSDYHIFDPDDAATAGIAIGARKVNDVIWSPGGDWSSLNIYSPGWIMLAQMVIFTGSFFHQPSQMLLLRQKLDAWKGQFGSQGFDLVGKVGDTDSVLRIFPVPQQDDAQVMVELSMPVVLADVNDSMSDYFYLWVEYYAADTLANLYATTAGINLLNFADSTAAMKYWEAKAKKYYDRAVLYSADIGGIAERS